MTKDKGKANKARIIKKHEELVDHQLGRHSKVLQARIDLRYPESYVGEVKNADVSTFFDYLERSLENKKYSGGHKADPMHLAVTEQNTSIHPHVHALVLMNGNAIQNPANVFALANKYWGKVLKTDEKGLVHYCLKDRHGNSQDNAIMVRRGHPDEYDQREACMQQASYLAKEKGKENKAKGAWSCFASRIPKKKDES